MLLNLTLVPNRSNPDKFVRMVRYEGVFDSDGCSPILAGVTPVRSLIEPMLDRNGANHRLDCTKVTELPWSSIKRETATDSQWAESVKPRVSETRANLIAEGRIKPAGYNWPTGYLGLTEMDWIRAERILAGLDSGELEPIVDEDADSELGISP